MIKGASAPARATARKTVNSNQNPPPISELAKQLSAADLRSKAVAALERGLFAKSKIYDFRNKQMVTCDDFKTQVAAATVLLAYTDGKPIERREIVQRNVSTLEDLRKRAKASPELRRAVRDLLEER